MSGVDGVLPPPLLPPVVREGGDGKPKAKKRQENASTGFGAAAMRGLTARAFTFYFRAPIRSFVRTRIE
jgi:hypothetical protein